MPVKDNISIDTKHGISVRSNIEDIANARYDYLRAPNALGLYLRSLTSQIGHVGCWKRCDNWSASIGGAPVSKIRSHVSARDTCPETRVLQMWCEPQHMAYQNACHHQPWTWGQWAWSQAWIPWYWCHELWQTLTTWTSMGPVAFGVDFYIFVIV